MLDHIYEAKRKVSRVFEVLAFDNCLDIHWKELLTGGFVCDCTLVSNRLHGYVSDEGYYCVEVHKRNGECLAALISGSFSPPVNMVGMAEGMSMSPPVNKKSVSSPE